MKAKTKRLRGRLSDISSIRVEHESGSLATLNADLVYYRSVHQKCSTCQSGNPQGCWYADRIRVIRSNRSSSVGVGTVTARHISGIERRVSFTLSTPAWRASLTAVHEVRRDVARGRSLRRRLDDDTGPSRYGFSFASRPSHWRQILLRRDLGPIGPEHHVGIEIECGVESPSMLISGLESRKLCTRVTVGEDGSLSFGEDHTPVELRICARQSDVERVVRRTCEAIADADGVVNTTCGLHVHLDMRRRDWRTCYRRLYAAMPWLFSMVPVSRVGNEFCEWPPEEPRLGLRYYAVNASSVEEHNTLEVRLHSGTVSAPKILYWVDLLTRIIDTDMAGAQDTLDGFLSPLLVSRETARYVRQRVLRFDRFRQYNLRVA